MTNDTNPQKDQTLQTEPSVLDYFKSLFRFGKEQPLAISDQPLAVSDEQVVIGSQTEEPRDEHATFKLSNFQSLKNLLLLPCSYARKFESLKFVKLGFFKL